MSFPDSGQAVPAASGGNNISLDNIRLSYVNNGRNGVSGWTSSNSKDDSEFQISFSDFDGATFTSGSPIDGDGSPALSIGTHFCGRTFGSGTVALTGVTISGDDTVFTTVDDTIQYTATPNSGATSVSYAWEWQSGQQGGSSTGGISDTTSRTPTITFDTFATSVLKVTASQSGASDVTDTYSINVS
jgi:hypothetical protein